MKRAWWTLAIVSVAASAVLAQSRPDFSGTWEMDAERTRAENQKRPGAGTGGGMSTMSGGGGGGSMSMSSGGGANAPASTVVRITQTAAALTIERVSGQVWEKVVHALDGTESVNVNGRTTMKLKSRWDGARLISEGSNVTELADGAGRFTGTIKEVRWIEKDGTMVIESTRVTNPPPGVQISNAGKPVTTVQYFKKK